MKPIRTFRSVPRLPSELEGLRTLAYNLWWCWTHTAIDLFRSLSPQLWEETNHNPVAMLGRLSAEELEEAAHDEAFRYRLRQELTAFEGYMGRQAWFPRTYPRETTNPLVGYFSAEYGLTESFRIYSGGLGILAGDHLKAASDLAVPLVGVGLFYHRGYFQQRLSLDGWQTEGYPFNDSSQQPMSRVNKHDGTPLLVDVLIGGEKTYAQIWKVQVGRLSLFLLDTNIQDNTPHQRIITDRLYGGDRTHRVSQEIVLGIGGVRALAAMGLEPEVYHMNEGHAAFLIVERLRKAVAAGLPLSAAMEAVRASNAFTTHTPVPAGNEVFPNDLLEYHLRPYLAEIGVSWNTFLQWGQIQAGQGEFGMTIFALRFSSYSNGVSRLHGHVSRGMWKDVWTGTPVVEVPIHHITNGTHMTTWASDELSDLYDAYLGFRWREEPENTSTWDQIEEIPPAELWRTHERSRERLIGFARKRLVRQLQMGHASTAEIRAASEALDPEAMTIGLARRFATYKRATLLFRNQDRLRKILTNTERPVQIIVAGKSHPDDGGGKELIREIFRFAQQPELRRHIVFLEDYDMFVSSLLVSGADVWLNTPRRPHEASGTSGMKAAFNGVLNVSILDGWWDEAYRDYTKERGHLEGLDDIGWAIGDGDGETISDREADDLDANLLYTLLEREIIPAFYDRGADGLPRAWIRRMKRAIRTLAPQFNTHRMVTEYVEQGYMPVALRSARLAANQWKNAKALGDWKEYYRTHFPNISVKNVEMDASEVVVAGTPVKVRVVANLGGLDPNDVIVQAGVGRINLMEIAAPMEEVTYTTLVNSPRSSLPEAAVFDGKFTCHLSGHVGVTVRILPAHPDLMSPFELGLVYWV